MIERGGHAVKAPAPAPCETARVCTVTWTIREDGWRLLTSRDETRSRLRALVPRVQTVGDVRILAPVDADAGGTWVGVNEWGVGACLLNGPPRDGAPRQAGTGPAGFTSRGLLVLDVLRARSVEDLLDRVRSETLDAYRGFSLLALGPGEGPRLVAWDGRRLVEQPKPSAPLVSSARDPEGTLLLRRRTFERMRASAGSDEAALVAFHRSHEPAAGPSSVCMHGVRASTVSLSSLLVEGGEARFSYADGPPCQTPLRPAGRLRLRPRLGRQAAPRPGPQAAR